MLYTHRDFPLAEQYISIHTKSGCVAVELTQEKGYPVSDLWPGTTKPTITWTNKEDNRTHITSISKLRQYFTYTEPEFTKHIRKWLNVHPNQFAAATEVLDYFKNGVSNVILTAEMQSGKTGTARYIVHSLLHLSGPSSEWDQRMKSENTYFICGMNDNDLRNQAVKEFHGLIPEKNILFSKQLQKHVPAWTPANAPCLVIVDESHYASNVNSLVDKFLKELPKNHLLLSVSATAMAELATSESLGKAMVYLHPGDNYYSIRDIFKRNLVFQSINITTHQADFVELVADEYQHQMDHNERKYNIVRIPSQWYYQDLEDDIKALGLDIDFINHHTAAPSRASSSGSLDSPAIGLDFNSYINEPPSRFTIIWIYGSLRAGKQVNTANIGFVHDTADSAPDTIAQSLLGRILGYNKRNNHVKCYTDVKAATLMCTWMTNIYDVTKIPSGSRGIINGYNDTVKKWSLHPPIAIMLDIDTRSYFRALKQKHGNRYPYKQEFIDNLIDSTQSRHLDLIEKIFNTYEPGRCGGLMILTENSAHRTLHDYWDYNYNSWLNQTPVRGFDVVAPGKYYYIYANLNIKSPQYGIVLVTRKEYINDKGSSSYVKVKSTSRFQVAM
jgi:hypothetical protein